MPLTITKTFSIGGIPTDPSSVVLSDPSGAYGILNDATGAVVVAAGTPMNRLGVGNYQYTVPDADASTTYTVSVAFAFGGPPSYDAIVAVADINYAAIVFPDGLQTILNQLTALYAQITLSPKPSYMVGGQAYQWNAYLEILGSQIEKLSKLLAQQNPFEAVSIGR